jgi:transposase InsO family protein
MRLMRFSYEIKFTAGKNLATADALSRAPTAEPTQQDSQDEQDVNLFVRVIMDGFPASEKRMEEIRRQQIDDPVCSQVRNFCKTQWPEHAQKMPELKPYWTVRHELTIEDDILLFQSRLVIPKSLQKDILYRLHQGHQGIVKCRALARSCVWWPGVSKELEAMITACSKCEKERVHHPEPLRPTPTPDYPWQQVGMDLFEWNKQRYLLIVDYYSRWIKVVQTSKTTTAAIINHIKSIFARHGIPERVVSDNGPQFTAREFVRFSEEYDFVHITCSPYHSQGNGEAERAVQTVKNLLKKADDPYIALLNYRATPLQQGSSTAELLMSRKLRTRVPALPSQHVPQQLDHGMFKQVDTRMKMQQKKTFDNRHKPKPLPQLGSGKKVWVKGHKDTEAVVVGPALANPTRSYQLNTSGGNVRRNRAHLRGE